MKHSERRGDRRSKGVAENESERGDDGGRDENSDTKDDCTPDDTGRIVVALVGAETPGNVGTVARGMKNFGFEKLLLVDPPELDPDGEAYGFAGHAREDVLPNAREVSFDHLVEKFHTVGFTAITGEDARKHVRYPFSTPDELADSLREVKPDTALVFGRERVGLTNEELARIDEICAIPADPEYPTLNLGQAATIALYELRELTLSATQLPDRESDLASSADRERLYEQFASFLEAIGHPKEKRPKASRLFRRLLGRARPTARETITLLGIFRKGAMRAEMNDRGAGANDRKPSDRLREESTDRNRPEDPTRSRTSDHL